MKTRILSFIVLVFLLTNSFVIAQSVTVTNGPNIAGSPISTTESSIRITFSWSGTKSNPNNIWKFRISFGYPTGTGLAKSGTVSEYWITESTPYFDVTGYVLLPHYCEINMHEFTLREQIWVK